MITFIDIHIYDTVGADRSATNALTRARQLDIPCFTIGELVKELTIDNVQVQEGQHHQALINEENVDDNDVGVEEDDVEDDEDNQEERQRLQDRGYCPRCIDHAMAQENAQPYWWVEGCPSCDR